MHPTKTSPTYNLGAITRETGLKADTLRAWERRYNLPQPTRSEGRQRLYSQRDLETIKWLIARQEDGMRISQAVEMWRNQIADGVDPLAEQMSLEIGTAFRSLKGSNVADFKSQWIEACISFDEARAEQIITEAFSHYPPEIVCFDVLFAGLSEIGEAWYRGEVSVQQEHFASTLVARRLNTLIAGAPPPFHPERIVIASAPEEEHTIPSLLLTFLLKRRGWDVAFLGANVPLVNFRSTLNSIKPRLVILIAHQLFTASTLIQLIGDLDGLNTSLAFGGVVFNQVPGLDKCIPGNYLGSELNMAVPRIEQLLHQLPEKLSIPQKKPAQILEDFRAELPAIENYVREMIAPHPQVQAVNIHYLSRDILAALQLGDIALLQNNLDWVPGLLSNAHIPITMLASFLQIYQQAVDQTLGSRGASVANWLQNERNRLLENQPA